MTRVLSVSECKELESILRKGIYLHNYKPRIRIEYLALALSKYLYYADVQSWGERTAYAFRESPMGKGQRSQAIRFLFEKGLIFYDVNRRRVADDFFEKIRELEKEIEKKEKEGFRF